MSERQPTESEIQSRIDNGLSGLWYPVAPSWALAGDPLGVMRLGQNLVLWRDGNGNVQCLEDRCPHRAARLSLGWNLGDRIGCWYHGVQVDGEGEIVQIPAMSSAKPPRGKCVRAYPVTEAAEAIWVYFPAAEQDSPTSLELPEELVDDSYDWFLCVAKWKCNYTFALENVADPMHGAYLHSVSHSMARGKKSAKMVLDETDTGFIFRKSDQSSVNFDWVEFAITGAAWLRLEIPYGAGAGPGGNFGIVGAVTPVDRDHCLVFFWRTRKVQGWMRSIWRFMYKTRLEGMHWDVLEQDRQILENLAPDPRADEMLINHDKGVARLRKTLSRMARDQILAETTGKRAAQQ